MLLYTRCWKRESNSHGAKPQGILSPLRLRHILHRNSPYPQLLLIDLVLSRSYGPGRYDPAYEERGIDYPLPYVRWTEGRNMLSFLELVARNDVRVDPMITHSFAIEDAASAYKIVTGENKEPAVAILLYVFRDRVNAFARSLLQLDP